jgi:hypothetical protein
MRWEWVLVAMLASGGAAAQSTPPDASAAAAVETTPGPTAPPAETCHQLCAGQPVEIELLEAISSARNKIGDRFRLQLASPLMLDGEVIVPAGTPGMGEVVHADVSRGSGRPGELLLAARHLEVAGEQLPLRAMKLAARGKDKINTTLAWAYIAAPVGLFVHGDEVEVPAGTRAQAKLARDVDVPGLRQHLAEAPPVPTPMETEAAVTASPPATTPAASASAITE